MFFKFRKSTGAAEPSQSEAEAGLTAFASEATEPSVSPEGDTPDGAPSSQTAARSRAVRVASWIVVFALSVSVAGAAGTWEYKRRSAARSAFLSVETSIPGVEVAIGGRPVGHTPVALWLQPGSYPVSVGQAAERREFTVDLAAGSSVYRHIDSGPPSPAATATAGTAEGQHLRIETGSPSMAVFVDGIARGMSPVSVQGLTAGNHDVMVRGAGASLRHKVVIRPRESTVLVFPSAAKAETSAASAPLAAGWLAVTSGIPVQIREDGKILGNTEADRVMLPTGEHTLEFVNEPLGYQFRRAVRIDAGKTTALQLEPVNGVLSINAQPWAEVWVDGERVGETPIGNLSRPIGPHEVVLRHPQLGERRERVTITTRQPARLGVDLRKK